MDLKSGLYALVTGCAFGIGICFLVYIFFKTKWRQYCLFQYIVQLNLFKWMMTVLDNIYTLCSS